MFISDNLGSDFMFINWKMVVTAIIVLAVLAVFLANNPVVSRFFSSLNERFGDFVPVDKEVSRPVRFSLVLDSYEQLSFASERMLNISITGDTTALIQEGRINANKSLNMINYRGTVSIGKEMLRLQGGFEKLELEEISLFLNGPVELNSSYSVISMDNLALNSFSSNSSGTLSVRDAEAKFRGVISIENPLGTFVFRANNTLSIEGSAQKIEIPNIGINVQGI